GKIPTTVWILPISNGMRDLGTAGTRARQGVSRRRRVHRRRGGSRQRRRYRSPRRGHSLLRHQDDLDAAVLGAAFQRRVVSHRLELAEGGGGQGGRLDAQRLEIAGDVDRARGRQLPVGWIALG